MADAFLRERFPGAAELIVVDDGSRPDERIRAEDLPPGVRLTGYPKNLGKGGAVRAGVAKASGEYVVFTDSDLPFGLEPIVQTIAWLREGADIVIGDRLLPESVCEADVTPLRRLSSAVFTGIVRHAVGLDFPDTQCGYKGYRAAVARDLFGKLEITSFAFDVEILLRALKKGYHVRRQPLTLIHNEDTSVRLSKHAPRMFADTFRIAWRGWRGRYD